MKKFMCANCGVEFFSREYEELEECVGEIKAYCNKCREIIGRVELKRLIKDEREMAKKKLDEIF